MLYIAFVDFKKFFDTINRTYLLYKLLKYNVTGKFYSLLKSMYEQCDYCVKTEEGLTQNFQSTKGVKQGCNLSPTLANLYQNDLHDIFDESCDPVVLQNTSFNSLSWADDVVPLSEMHAGLQKCLDRLSHYCDKWDLRVNEKKTVGMIMEKHLSKNNRSPLRYKEATLPYKKSVKYLGLETTYNGNTDEAIKSRVAKADRAINMCKQAFSAVGNVNAGLDRHVRIR